MLRLRTLACRSVKLGRLNCLSFPYPSQPIYARRQAFATITEPDHAAHDPSSTEGEARPEAPPLNATHDNITEAFKADPSLEKSDEFDRTLDVVRKVYGIKQTAEEQEKLKKKRKRKKKKQQQQLQQQRQQLQQQKEKEQEQEQRWRQQEQQQEQQQQEHQEQQQKDAVEKPTTERVPGSLAHSIGAWASLQEKLQGSVSQEYPEGAASSEVYLEEQVMDPSTLPPPEQEASPPEQTEQKAPSKTKKKNKKLSNSDKKPSSSNNEPFSPKIKSSSLNDILSSSKADKAKPKRKERTERNPNRSPVVTFNPEEIEFKPVEVDSPLDIAKLAHNLDRVLFNSGVYELQDKRSRVFNFDPALASIMPVKEFDFDAIAEYITSSKDVKLRDLCKKYDKKYCGSTSSMTALLSQFHFLLSAWRKLTYTNISKSFRVEYDNFTLITRAPAAVFATLKDGVYAIDADKQFDSASVLSMLGKSMEKFLTLPTEDFEKYHRSRSHELSEEERNAEEGFHYTTIGDFMLRSQLDAHDSRLPGTGMFDLKTRAVLPIRMDAQGYEKGVGYEIQSRTGSFQSYEREYYDMVRSAFLKYSLQVRMGRMDGIFVAFHNTQRIFGFQYISLEEMDHALHGAPDRAYGDAEFKASVRILNDLMDRAAKKFPGRSLRLHVETRQGLSETSPPLMYFFAQPVEDDFIKKTQETNKASVDALQREILGLAEEEAAAVSEEGTQPEQEPLESEEAKTPSEEPSQEEDDQGVWEELIAKVDEIVEGDSRGLETVRESLHEALTQSGLLQGRSEEEQNTYLNSLVEALAAELPGGKESGEESDELREDEQDETEVADEEAVGQDAELNGETSSPGDAAANMTEGVETTTTDGEEATKTEGEETITTEGEEAITTEGAGITTTEGEDAIAAEGAETTMTEGEETARSEAAVEDVEVANGDSASEPSLKDLILKVAQNLENSTTTNLGVFELVLSRLVAESSKEEAEQDADPALPVETTVGEAEAASQKSRPAKDEKKGQRDEDELMGVYVTVRNMQNGKSARRFRAMSRSAHDQAPLRWKLDYLITELPKDKARGILAQLRARRRKMLVLPSPQARQRAWLGMWGGRMAESVEESQAWRGKQDELDADQPVKVAWMDGPLHEAKK